MEVTVLGASPAVQNPGGACSGYLVTDSTTEILVDCGHGVVSFLRTATDLQRLSGVVISHMHPDHIFDLVPLAYGFKFGGLPPIPLWLPPNGYPILERLQAAVGLADAFFSDTFQLASYGLGRDIEIGTVSIAFADTRHYIPAYAMRFTSQSGSGTLVYTSDTGWSEVIRDFLHDASLAIVEASVPEYHSESDEYGHLTPKLAGTIAREAGVDRLVITHFAHVNAERARREASEAFGSVVLLAREGDRLNV